MRQHSTASEPHPPVHSDTPCAMLYDHPAMHHIPMRCKIVIVIQGGPKKLDLFERW